MFRNVFPLAVVAAGLAGAPASADAQRRDRNRDGDRIDTAFAFDRTGTVVLGNRSATIVVMGWDEAKIRIRATADQGSLTLSVSARQVTLEPSRSSDDVEIEVWVPRGARVEAHTNSGDITIHGSRGDVDVQTFSGDVDIVDVGNVTASSLSGDVSIRTSAGVTATTNNGDLSISDAHGAIDATSISGDVSISRAVSKSVKARATSGDVSYSGTVEQGGRYELNSHSGDIEMSVPRDAGAQVDVTTWNGSLDSDFPITIKPTSSMGGDMTKRFSFTIGSGSARITLETFNGDIVITSRGTK